MIILSIGILILSIVCHEFGHAIMAYGLGDPTAKREGRLSLNPIVHLDLLGSVIVPALLWITNTGFLKEWNLFSISCFLFFVISSGHLVINIQWARFMFDLGSLNLPTGRI